MYECTPSSTQIRGLNLNVDPQGSFLGGQKLGISAMRATQKPFLHHGEEKENEHRSRLQHP